jgi:uncharacterized membrane protein YhiD involved in acid resistance
MFKAHLYNTIAIGAGTIALGIDIATGHWGSAFAMVMFLLVMGFIVWEQRKL